MGNISAIGHLLEHRPELAKHRRGLPGTGKRQDNQEFFEELKLIDDAFIYSNSLYAIEHLIDPDLVPYNAGGGSPLRVHPFPPASKALCKIADSELLSQYQHAAGDIECRESVAAYLQNCSFSYNSDKGISSDNIIFTDSTTEAFYILIKLISRPYDVVLFTGPTYGLFAYIPEHANAISRFLPLRQEDGWLVNPALLMEKIKEINAELIELAKLKRLSYIPKVIAFLNINPGNPTGKVMGKAQIPILQAVIQVCAEEGVFVIDDIIYRELCFDSEDPAIPLATLGIEHSNVVTLMGLSKAYGLAGARAGMIVADKVIIRGARDFIFQQMDSTPFYVGQLLKAAFDPSRACQEAHREYFTALHRQYVHKWQLIRALIEGVVAVDETERDHIAGVVHSLYGDAAYLILKPIPEIQIAGGIIPQSGFFVLLDFTKMRGKRYEDVCIKTERDVLYFYYRYAHVKLLMGKSIAWPKEDEFIARVSFAMADSDIIHMIKQMKDAVRKLQSPGGKNNG